MAGDWIKVEHATLDKPELGKFARLLGVSRGDALLLLLRFWCWADGATSNGVCNGVVTLDVDEMMRCPGFGKALEAVGWLTLDDANERVTIPNFDRHHGKSAKNRALTNRRVAEHRAASNAERNADSVTKTVTREEKRRVDTSLRSVSNGAAKKTREQLTEPTSEHQALATTLGVSCQAEFQKFRDWLASSGKRQADEAAGFRNWLRRSAEMRRPAAASPAASLAAQRAANMAALTGRVANGGHIAGTAERVDSAVVRALPSDLRKQSWDDVG